MLKRSIKIMTLFSVMRLQSLLESILGSQGESRHGKKSEKKGKRKSHPGKPLLTASAN